jgi:Cytochrome c oxidase subunit IV/Cupredoxin-like domain
MFEDIWNGIIELTSRYVIPDWTSVIAMLPVIIFVLAIIVVAILFWKLTRAPKPRRGKARLEPIPPPGVHMPGPSLSPFLAAIGAFSLFLGLVFGGWLLIIGAIVLTVTLLHWLVEAVRLYDRDLGATATPMPVIAHDGPPAGVHMPGPSFLPFLAAIGMAMLMLGLVFGGWLLAVGVVAFVLSLLGWMRDARREYVATVAADRTGHLESLPDPRTPKWLLTSFGLLLAIAFVVQVGWIPPQASGGETAAPSGGPPGPGGSGEPGASPGAGGEGDGPVIHAKDIAFVQTSFSAPADQPFQITFVNEDDKIPHNIEIKDETGLSVFQGKQFPGVETMVYDVPPLGGGSYSFVCTVHPTMTGSATIQ